MSRRPSPSPSTARRWKVEGMNWVCPKAPAHDPRRRAGVDVAVLDDLEGRHQLAGEVVAPARAVAGDGRERLHEGTAADILAEIRFDAPDAGDREAVDPVARFRRRERLPPLAHGGLAVLDAFLVDEGGEIVPDRRLELGLVVHQLEDLQVGLDAPGRRVECLAGNALGGGLAAQPGKAGAEVRLRRSPLAQERRRKERASNRTDPHRHLSGNRHLDDCTPAWLTSP